MFPKSPNNQAGNGVFIIVPCFKNTLWGLQFIFRDRRGLPLLWRKYEVTLPDGNTYLLNITIREVGHPKYKQGPKNAMNELGLNQKHYISKILKVINPPLEGLKLIQNPIYINPLYY